MISKFENACGYCPLLNKIMLTDTGSIKEKCEETFQRFQSFRNFNFHYNLFSFAVEGLLKIKRYFH